jgi:hypothetical protein
MMDMEPAPILLQVGFFIHSTSITDPLGPFSDCLFRLAVPTLSVVAVYGLFAPREKVHTGP